MPLSSFTRGLISSTLRPPVRMQPGALGGAGHLRQRGFGALFVGRSAPVEGDDHALVLEPDPLATQQLTVHPAGVVLYPLGPLLQLPLELGRDSPGAQHLGAVVAEVGDAPDRDDPPRLRGPAPAHAGDEPRSGGRGGRAGSGSARRPRRRRRGGRSARGYRRRRGGWPRERDRRSARAVASARLVDGGTTLVCRHGRRPYRQAAGGGDGGGRVQRAFRRGRRRRDRAAADPVASATRSGRRRAPR